LKPHHAFFSIALIIGIASSAAAVTLMRSGNSTLSTSEAKLALAASRRVAALGRIEPIAEDRDIAAVITGKIKAVSVDEGSWVTAGQIVAELESDDMQARVMAAEGKVKLREAELQRLLNGARKEEREEARAQVADAEAVLFLAKQNRGRRERLAEKGIISTEQIDETRSAMAGAEARKAIQLRRLELLLLPPRPEDVAKAEAELAIACAGTAEAKANLAKTLISSPIDGVVLRRYRVAGETVSNQIPMPIVRIGDTRHLRARVEVDETDIAYVTVGQRAYVAADAYGDQRFWGTVKRVGSMMGRKRLKSDDPAERIDTKAIEVLIDLDDSPSLPIGLRVDTFIAETPVEGEQQRLGSRSGAGSRTQ
jgi:HlyD family secretion protein